MDQALGVDYEPVSENDFATVFAFYAAATMPEMAQAASGNLQEAREKLRATYDPIATRFILVGGERVGIETSYPEGEDLWRLAHLHILPEHQRRGIGTRALEYVKIEAQIAQRHLIVNAPRDSHANQFLKFQGFVPCGHSVDEIQYRWDVEKFE